MQENNLGIYDVLYFDTEEVKYDYARYYAEDEDHAVDKFCRQYPERYRIQEVIYRGEA